MMFRNAARYIIEETSSAINNLNDREILEISKIIAGSPRIFVYGSGRSGLIGRCFATRLVQLGKVAYFIGESTTPITESRDCVFLISNSGKTKSTLLVASITKRIGSTTICLTSEESSPLAKICDKKIVINFKEINTTYAPLGTIFEISALILLDAIIAELMQLLGENEKSMRRRHAIWV